MNWQDHNAVWSCITTKAADGAAINVRSYIAPSVCGRADLPRSMLCEPHRTLPACIFCSMRRLMLGDGQSRSSQIGRDGSLGIPEDANVLCRQDEGPLSSLSCKGFYQSFVINPRFFRAYPEKRRAKDQPII
jgi:hypothetical protein